jgi:hypothetical protein
MPTKIFGPDKSGISSGTFPDISEAGSSSSGTEARFIEPSSSSNSLAAILESKPFTSPDMRLSSTPMNSSGTISNEVWPTVFPKTLNIFDGSLNGLLEDSGIPRDSSGRAFTHPNYLGDVYPFLNERSVDEGQNKALPSREGKIIEKKGEYLC